MLVGHTPKVIKNAEGARLTPSQVAFTKDGECLVGMRAEWQAVMNSANTFSATKRFFGRQFDDPAVQNIMKHLPYKINRDLVHGACVQSSDIKAYSPSEIGAHIFTKMKQTAESYLNTNVTNAVVAVPPSFNNRNRSAIIEAGRISGLNVLSVIEDSTAAALAYGVSWSRRKMYGNNHSASSSSNFIQKFWFFQHRSL